MIYRISKKDKNLRGEIHLPTSKSESNRALIIRALSMNKFDIKNLSTADDTTILNSILQTNITDLPAIIDVGAAGTAMRFLTAYFSILEGKKIITGSTRMKERPIKLLVEALRSLGAEINYLENDGFPPIEIIGKQIEGGEIIIDGSMSSQYLSALAMIAPTLPNGLKIYLKGEIISKPYLLMTLKMMEFFGVHYSWRGNEISISHQEFNTKKNSAYSIEGDWSSASYW